MLGCHVASPGCNVLHKIDHGGIIFLALDGARCFGQKASVAAGRRGSLSCGSDDGCRRAVPAGALSCADRAIRLQKPAMGCSVYAPPRAASVRSVRRYLHRAHSKHPAPGESWHALPQAVLPEPVLVAPSAGRRR